ncbi:GGDEF domain-containing protein [Candidatus Parabeggiatoa sp. HSG14]|uniref:sensor domain-containing diguanylate cyclase n=1 Tax=Candidatus Parabeggiatoa sp. HSG14 TaxID=3055593 RepID=UPI0025A6FE56|nr:GGDEF domain-containing protein [Thiotrichales bacterium HSG14]
MPRFTTKLFTDLVIWMIGFGLLNGASFPFFAYILGIEAKQVFTFTFWTATLTAGLVAGLINYTLVRLVVRPRLKILADHMRIVEKTIGDANFTGNWSSCSIDICRVPVDSNDEIGESAKAFNDLVEALFRAHNTEIAVSDFSKTLSSQLELDILSKQALELFLQYTNAMAGAILTESAGELVISAHHGINDPKTLPNSDYVRQALRTHECQRVQFPPDVQIEAVLVNFRPQEIIVVPLEFKNAPLGVVILAANQTFSPDITRLLQFFRRSFSLALNNALIHSHLQRIAALDTLTGAYNRRFGLIRLREEFNRAVRTGSSLGIIMMDIDHFKSINDTYGHLVGDRVLGQIAESTRQALREGDLMVRYGGEEFLIILPGASLENGTQIGERVRRLIADAVVKDGKQFIHFTASLGVTAFPIDNVEHELELVKHADAALYAAKHQGRDRVVVMQ